MTGRRVLDDGVLRALRGIGDPGMRFETDALEPALALVRGDGLVQFAAGGKWEEMVRSGLPHEPPEPLDAEKLAEAQRLFQTFGTEIAGALLLAALPQSYATAFGAGVLGASAGLETDTVRRIRGTAHFLVLVMQRAPDVKQLSAADRQRMLWDPSGSTVVGTGPAPWQLCTALRVYHQAIRVHLEQLRTEGDVQVIAQLGEHNAPPLNQEDLLGMLLSFSVTVFEVLERYGITWTADEQEAYLHLWDVIGAYLGIGSPKVVAKLPLELGDGWHGLRPPSVGTTRAMLDQLRSRQWIDPAPTAPFEVDSWSSLRAGRVLTKALLDELAAAMPPALALLPITVMRSLAPEVVRRRLGLGASGIVMRSLGQLPTRRRVVGRFTEIRTPNPVGARVLRLLANEVTSRASLRFARDGDLTIPGLDIVS